MPRKRRICFVTGTRAEFGLMVRTLKEIAQHPKLEHQIIATGMHLASSRGRSIKDIKAAGLTVSKIVRWNTGDLSPEATAVETGRAISQFTRAYTELKSDIVLVVGDRVEAFAAASAGHISGKIVAHVHGGDRALGLVDDALRHAISKLSHIHFAATAGSARRLLRMGEDRWRIVRSGSPGIDGIREDAAGFFDIHQEFGVHRKRFALLALHPTSSDDSQEFKRARRILLATLNSGVQRVVVVCPNTDPGSEGIRRCWERLASHPQLDIRKHIPRDRFLGLLRDCAFLIGNSSSGIIEAASFGKAVIDIGPRQQGRECGRNVIHVEDQAAEIVQAIAKVWRQGSPLRFSKRNIYGSGAAKIISQSLASLQLDERLKRKLIAY